MKQDFFNSLNCQQIESVKYTKGPCIIMAGAGSGKTRVLVHKVLYFITEKKFSPESIIMITFTNKAAGEMAKRVKKTLGFIGTFHSFCAKILRRDGAAIDIDPNFVIYDDNDQQTLIKNILKQKDISKWTPAYFLNRISAAKNQLITPKKYLELFSDYNAPMIAEIYQQYQNTLAKNKALDFDDLIMKTVELFVKKDDILQKYQQKFRAILVDEFQDTNYAQYTLTRLLSEKNRVITVVGDFSQSIYSWRGADIRNLEKFKEDFPETKTYFLEENYRSTQKILDFAYKVISNNQTHPILHLFTKNSKGEEIIFHKADNEEYEAIFLADTIRQLVKTVSYSAMSVLYRTNAQSRIIEEAFLHYGIPYILIGGTRFYERKEIKDILSFLRLLINIDDEVAKDRVVKIGKKKWEAIKKCSDEIKDRIEEKTTSELMEEIFQSTDYLKLYNPDDEEDFSRLENIKELRSVAITYPKLTEFLEQVALVENEYFEGEKRRKNNDGVRLMTLHQAKGLEFPYVFIVGVEEGILPHSRSIDDMFSLEEERRLFYVGITRAEHKLYITYAKRRFIFGRRGESVKSRFIEDYCE
ncbi:MAG: ATP-dependent DNA helicase PcrA [Candidatus Roizmanbacteria bacterium GW2011_GWA2_36_23]|uniref:DNA 3'-5' helicase n=1 Tax=Candidatus Roizmanbacteria bacterium GW2011_GWA2_36_23 TaxID=1618480 RepID=A0A0G0GQY0_9BACT|nr:MAG: ATP-dependent DNA helicase PcrA [Candidatus Roizmanbacteria bacterium GW2011_GWA2_36_23]